jgi:hypothetical protein
MSEPTNFQKEHRVYQLKMAELRDKLPKNWIKQVLMSRDDLTVYMYQKYYNDLVNIVNGRSYKLYVQRQDLVKEVEQLTKQ